MSSVGPVFSLDVSFKRPPEAPVFDPTEEEFRDPLSYINKIRPIAEKTGICRIRPPVDWQPPFAADVTNFRFTPRLQRLNELEALTRVKLNFLDQIASFWELQGTRMKIPTYDGKTLDLYSLHRVVQSEGGFHVVSSEKKWGKIARRMKMSNDRAMSSILKYNYEKVLKPFDIFKENCLNKKSRRIKEEAPEIKMEVDGKFVKGYQCLSCMGRESSKEKLLFCTNCKESYHKLCLLQPLPTNPKCAWRCPKCIAEEVAKREDAFGFEEADREYTLVEFGEMADAFKTNYFKRPAHTVPLSIVEKEFWKIVSSIDETVTVEYGSDLHSIDRGSGFPTKDTINPITDNPDIMKYVNSPWNLNNFPVLDGSVFGHIPGKISGVKTPWMYVGMCFATFCWHIEDHWSYSINYLHWGEPKTWYGVPGNFAPEFEITMKKVAPELFEIQPDLLHQLTTMLNPTALINDGIPVYRTDQSAGEFVITFPRAYHSGFNQGYNCAEAVNFGPADWLMMGRECVTHYSIIHRHCVFSHDELICKIALDAENIDPRIAAATFYDMLQMVVFEKKMRKHIFDWGVRESRRDIFEKYTDEERQCDFCKTLCFVSGVTCDCKPFKLVCLQHHDQLCTECPPNKHRLKYRFNLSELSVLLHKLKLKAETFDAWMYSVNSFLEDDNCQLSDLSKLKELIVEAKEKKFPDSIINPVLNSIREAEKRITMSFAKESLETIILD
ncbi:lysine-specific demethylase lid-like [Cimex lectularius]|uniref:[histone H3]-trimethyl-L-lysine(4) demethylase n=1 Tax=Cimex lectularius TaxID=79782 RepID=A0A8I6R6C9_CIMLE|nr:lysine-specific demethylase lid-like [Cimex lectularius]XP_014239394.1 lysine-specific demethylase lid-like [Cimex lectularius]XP_014239395.1 lysine-specific demethylase lid-like [Cimex lectularius]XP_014239397.1 lysine-specific demethylase lid-like [Cimex lectularius]XP_024080899.1 lysine-specific demethylase lid-like [Cimex lectularius]